MRTRNSPQETTQADHWLMFLEPECEKPSSLGAFASDLFVWVSTIAFTLSAISLVQSLKHVGWL
jgi:hypothetical protein